MILLSFLLNVLTVTQERLSFLLYILDWPFPTLLETVCICNVIRKQKQETDAWIPKELCMKQRSVLSTHSCLSFIVSFDRRSPGIHSMVRQNRHLFFMHYSCIFHSLRQTSSRIEEFSMYFPFWRNTKFIFVSLLQDSRNGFVFDSFKTKKIHSLFVDWKERIQGTNVKRHEVSEAKTETVKKKITMLRGKQKETKWNQRDHRGQLSRHETPFFVDTFL